MSRRLLLLFVLLCGGGGAMLLRLRVAPPPSFLPSALLLRRRSSSERVCAPAHLALVVVRGADSHTRQLIRETWGHIFHTHVLGVSVSFAVSVHEPADLESALFGDFLNLQPGRDGPLDLLQAAREACRRPRFVVVLEEDIFVNMFAMVDFLKDLLKRPLLLQHRNALWCNLQEAGSDVTTSTDANAPTGEPRHCLPGVFITVPSAADAILLAEHSNNISQTITSLAQEAGVELVQVADKFNENRTLIGQTIFSRVGQDEDIVRRLWKRLVEGRKDSGL